MTSLIAMMFDALGWWVQVRHLMTQLSRYVASRKAERTGVNSTLQTLSYTLANDRMTRTYTTAIFTGWEMGL
jgi:hypothetical protein